MEGHVPHPDERARTELDLPSVAWDEGSRFRSVGRIARRALQRVLRPYLVRRRGFDEAVVESLRLLRQRSELGRLALLAETPPEDAVERETDVGTLWLDRRDRLITPLIEKTADWEGDVTRFLRASLRPGMVFVDVGANVGYFSVLASRLVEPSGTVVAVEPEPRTLRFLRANLWRHACANAVVLPIAASAERGWARLVQNEVGLAGSSLEERPGEGTLTVPCGRLDDLLDGWRVDVLKVDIERHEHVAIEGARALIEANPSIVIVCEFWPHEPNLVAVDSPADVLELYEGLGFQLNRLTFHGEAVPVTSDELLAEEGPLLNIVLTRRAAPETTAG